MDDLEKIKDILEKHIGKNNTITSGKVAKQLGYNEDDTHARTRKLILDCAKKYELPLAASTKGYYLITNKEEFDKYIKNLNTRITGIEERITVIKDNYNKYMAKKD